MENYQSWINIIEYFKTVVGTGITVLMFLEMFSMLLIFLLIRVFIFFKIEGLKFFKDKSEKNKSKKAYIIGHITIEGLIAFALAYIIIVLRCADSSNYIWNMIFAPGVGLTLAILIDFKIIMKQEENAPVSLSLSKIKKGGGKASSGSTSTQSPQTNNTPNINIQVNTGNGDIVNPNKEEKKNTDIPEILPHIKDDEAESDNFNNSIIKHMNNIIDVQTSSINKIDKIGEQCDKMGEIIKNLQEAEMKEYQIKLKQKMYFCLNKGFVTPMENEEIESAYYSYTKLLGGNGEVKALHDQRFVKLDIHEDRRKQNIPVEKDRRKPSN